MSLKLVDVYSNGIAHMILWDLLREREPHQNISHKQMPTWGQHFQFVKSMPYKAWYLIEVDGTIVGATYLSKQDEIGIQLLKTHQGNGHGKAALSAIMAAHPCERYLANINPANEASKAFFDAAGFRLIQHTYELCPNAV